MILDLNERGWRLEAFVCFYESFEIGSRGNWDLKYA